MACRGERRRNELEFIVFGSLLNSFSNLLINLAWMLWPLDLTRLFSMEQALLQKSIFFSPCLL